jgi:hypothetical protein
MKAVWPLGIFGMLLSMVVLAVLYALLYQGGQGVPEGPKTPIWSRQGSEEIPQKRGAARSPGGSNRHTGGLHHLR